LGVKEWLSDFRQTQKVRESAAPSVVDIVTVQEALRTNYSLNELALRASPACRTQGFNNVSTQIIQNATANENECWSF
jgi:hypothetical protein